MCFSFLSFRSSQQAAYLFFTVINVRPSVHMSIAEPWSISRIYDDDDPPQLTDFDRLADRTADEPVDIPESLPRRASRSSRHRFTDTPVYAALETNVDAAVMAYSQEPIPEIRSKNSINLHGPDTPFRHHSVIRQYVEDLLNRNGYQDLVEYRTTVERAVKDPSTDKWILTLRRQEGNGQDDYWWQETFDALVVASGHFSVPYIPRIPGLKEFAEAYPGSVEHTKGYRDPERYRGKVSAASLNSLIAAL